jgi:imidazolonepropionase-like amidohydrolase
MTLEAASVLGIQRSTGSLAEGKDATFFISDGDILDMKSSLPTAAWIMGRQISLDNIQTQLNRKYREKYGLK